MENNLNEDYQVLNNVQGSIRSFDNKAGILVSVIGIVFGLSLYFLGTFDSINQLIIKNPDYADIYNTRYIVFSIVYGVFFLVALVSIICCLFVFYPRKNKKGAAEININYYWNLSNMNFDSYKTNKQIWKTDENVVWEQIKRNSDICKIKHRWLNASIFTFCAFIILFVALVVLHIVFVR